MILPWRRNSLFGLAIALVALVALVTASPTTNSTTEATPVSNYNCPVDCRCELVQNAPPTKQILHAKCSSLTGLRTEDAIAADLPIHSIDLSNLRLTRLAHSLEKLHDLTAVDLSYNELHEIGHLGRRIKKLNLRHNRLTSAKLTKLPQHVQVLNLQHNDITYLPLEFTQLSHLQSLELSDNAINCSCETLEVRNWLQDRSVFMERPVICSQPAEAKGKPWLQLKQANICRKETAGWLQDEEENELMLGDQPVEGSGDNNNDDEELGKDFMPLDSRKSQVTSSPGTNRLKLDDVEGSGDLSEMSLPLGMGSTTEKQHLTALEENEDEENEEGSGSGGGIFMIPSVLKHFDDFETKIPDEVPSPEDDDDFDSRPVETPAPEPTPSPEIFGTGMGIFDGGDGNDGKPAEEESIVPMIHHHVEGGVATGEVITDAPLTDDSAESEDIQRADMSDKDDSNATYLLMGVILLIVIGLLLFVGIKRCKNHHANDYDAENPNQTELQPMDKKNLGKPLQHNGHENSPLIGEKSKSDLAKPVNGAGKKPYSGDDVKDGPAQQQPLLNGNGTSEAANRPSDEVPKINEPVTEQAPHEYYPITPRYPPPKSPRASKYAQYPQVGEQNNNVTEPYLPSSPKTGRYSPVYSPETGRVKIKLSETPKPKTPMLVNRTKSNAGDIVTTPVSALNADIVPPVHGGV